MNKFLAFNIGDEFKLGGEAIAGKTGYKSLGDFISSVLPNVYIIAGIILFFLIFLGGFGMLTAGGDPEKLAQGGKAVTAAIIGFLLIFASYWIIQIIEVLTGISIFNPGV